MTKTCTKCFEAKDTSNFYRNDTCRDKLAPVCKECLAVYNKHRRQKNAAFIAVTSRNYALKNKERLRIARRAWEKANPDRHKANQNRWVQNNTEKVNAKKIKWAKRNPEKVTKALSKYRETKQKTDFSFVVLCRLRGRLRRVLRGTKKNTSILKLIGCSPIELRNHIESLFKKGMNWENRGLWHIDHIKPCSLFDLTQESDQRECFNFKNLQPLWATDNLKKRNRWPVAINI